MIALICLLVPPLVLVLAREKSNHKQIKIRRVALAYLVGVLLLNGLMILILYLFFNNYGQLFSKLNRYYNFACKYFALSMVLALLEPCVEFLYRKVCSPAKTQLIKLSCNAKSKIVSAYRAIRSICMKVGGRNGRKIKVPIFLLIAAIILSFLNFIAQPVWGGIDEYNSFQGFYEEPENTIETIFLGASITAAGFIPAELYGNFGICSCDLGNNSQPMLASYYWLEEAYRLHSETLDTVVLDVSELRRGDPSEAQYHKALDHMKLSSVKLHAIKNWANDFDEALSYLFPVLSYHERWKSLTETDFEKSEEEADISSRGYYFNTTRVIDNVSSYSSIALPLYALDESAVETEFNTESLYYIKKIITFCEENSIKLVLTKTLQNGWTSSNHNGVEAIAEEYGLEFIDFNFDPYLSEVGLSYSTDFYDVSSSNAHMNYYGATKFTNWFGNYLIEECGNRDVRDDERYAFMEEELDEYYRSITKIRLNEITDPCEYISYLMEQGDYAIFISVKDEASNKLTQTQRDAFASMGLEKLSELGYRASYLTVIDDGEIIVELTEEDPGEEVDEAADNVNDMEHIEEIYRQEKEEEALEEEEEELTIEYEGSLEDGTEYKITSGGYYLGNISSILIDGTEYSTKSRGLNIVVYDKEREEVIDKVSFDTCASAERDSLDYAKRLEDIKESGKSLSELTGKDRQLYLYDRACAQRRLAKMTAQEAGESGLVAYLTAFWEEEGCEIYISAKEEAADALTDDVRDALRELGLTELAELQSGDSYLAVIQQGVVWIEESGHEESPVDYYTDDYMLVSGGVDSGNTSSIMINGTEYSNKKRGLNIVIYDAERKVVVDQITYDTSTVPQAVSEESR